jgi:hypothetical protein
VNILNSSVLKTDARVGVVIPSPFRHNFSPMVLSIRNELFKSKMDPFFVVKPSTKNTEIFSKFKYDVSGMKNIQILDNGSMDRAIIDGFDIALRNGAGAVFCMPDDFDHLVKFVPSFARKLGGEYGFLSCKWDKTSQQFLPEAVLNNEKLISCGATYLDGRQPADSPPSADSFEGYIAAAKERGTWYQAYLGVFGSNGSSWKGLKEATFDAFGSDPRLLCSIALDIVFPLLAMRMGLKVNQVAVPKRFEHALIQNGTEAERKFVESRLMQFDQGARALIAFADKYCAEKLLPLLLFLNDARKVLAASHFHPEGGKVKPSKWNTPLPTSYQPEKSG